MIVETLEHGLLVSLEAPDSKRETLFAGGRRALSRALAELGAPEVIVGADDRGAPALPTGFVGSVSHKGTTCVALAAVDDGVRIGVDVEYVAEHMHPRFAEKILVAEELSRLVTLDEAERRRHVLVCFSIKESIYKAIDPYLRRYVGFHEAVLGFDGARVSVRLELTKGERAPLVEATWSVADGRILTTARARMP